MAQYLIGTLLDRDLKVALISRGYGRSTKGLYEVHTNSQAGEVGDEPLLIKLRFPEIRVWVSEERKPAVLLAEKEGVQAIVLDDNFQHRWVKPHFQLLLSRYTQPFFRDFPLPWGRLREFRSGAKRADMVVFTHSPTEANKKEHIDKTGRYTQAPVLFTRHHNPEVEWQCQAKPAQSDVVFTIAGLADDSAFVKACTGMAAELRSFSYRDHMPYTAQQVEQWLVAMREVQAENKKGICITTAKDWAKLKDVLSPEEIETLQLGYLPVEIVPENPEEFDRRLNEQLKKYT